MTETQTTGINMKKKSVFMGLTLVTISMSPLAETDHNFDFGGRVRYVHIDNVKNDGKAASLLLRGELDSQWHKHWSSLLQIDYIESYYKNEHSDGKRNNGKPLVADVPGSEINQLFLKYERDDWILKLGRQLLEVEDQRFIGSNSFWQNDQTFDSILSKKNILENSSLTYTYTNKVHRIWGDNNAVSSSLSSPDMYGNQTEIRDVNTAWLGEHTLDSHFIQGNLNELDYSKFVVYYYQHKNKSHKSESNTTYGLNHSFTYKSGRLGLKSKLEFAQQHQPEAPYDGLLPYYLFDLNSAYNAQQLGVRIEALGTKGGTSFIFPLSSLHGFQGWADKFSVTPENGLIDSSLRFKFRKAPWRLEVRYHWFTEYRNNTELGEELNLDIVFKPKRKHKILLRIADFKQTNHTNPIYKSELRAYLDYSYNL